MSKTNKIFSSFIILYIIFGLTTFSAISKTNDETVMVPISFTTIADQAKPAVVNIQTIKNIEGGGRVYKHFFGQPFGRNNDMFNEFFNEFFNQAPKSRKESSLGSGFIVSKDGYIVTNNHVIKNADEVKVILYDKTEHSAKVIGADPATDLALIKIKGKKLTPLSFGKSSQAKIGSWVVAIGSPFGLEQTVTAGIISAKGRILGSGPYDDFIQTDASINPGNSGGPLLNLKGEVIGINTAIIRSGQGIGFAIPSDLATGIIDQLKQNQHVSRGWLGVSIQDVNEDLAEYYKLENSKGVYVAKVHEGEPADKAGIKTGDIIVMINDTMIEKSRDLTFIIAGSTIGDSVKVKLIRNGKIKIVKVKLGKRPDQLSETIEEQQDFDSLGLKLRKLDQKTAQRFGYNKNTKGLIVTQIKEGSQAASVNIRPGDLLLEINEHRISKLKEYRKILSTIKKGKMIFLLFNRGNQNVFVVRFKKP